MKLILNNVPIENRVPASWELIKTVTGQLSTSSSSTPIEDPGITEAGEYKFVLELDTRHYLIGIRTEYMQSWIAVIGTEGGWISANTPEDIIGSITDTQIGYITHTPNGGIQITGTSAASTTINFTLSIYKAV